MSKIRRRESGKRKSSAVRTAGAEAKVPGQKSALADCPQSPAERRAAEAEVRKLIARFTPDELRLVAAMRKALQKRMPTAHVVVYEYRDCFVISFSPSEKGYEGVFAIRGSADGVKLYFNQGRDLPDPEKLLQGTSQTRFVDVETASTLVRPAIARLIDAALAHNRIPFASAGRGSVVVSPSTAARSKTRRDGPKRR